jgi:hypothetical protein
VFRDDKGVQFRVSVSYSLLLVRTRLCYLLHCPSRQLLRLYARPFTPGRPEETTKLRRLVRFSFALALSAQCHDPRLRGPTRL